MQRKVFYPRYTIKGSADVLSITLCLILALIFSFLRVGAILLNLVVLVVLVSFISWFSRMYIRRIIFTPSFFLVEKYAWPSKKIDYSDVIDIGIWRIQTRRGEVDLAAMSNVTQLHSLFFELMKEDKVDVDQSENQALLEDLVLQQSFWPKLIISAALSVPFLVYFYYSESHSNLLATFLVPVMIVLVISSVVSVVVSWFYKRRMKNQ